MKLLPVIETGKWTTLLPEQIAKALIGDVENPNLDLCFESGETGI